MESRFGYSNCPSQLGTCGRWLLDARMNPKWLPNYYQTNTQVNPKWFPSDPKVTPNWNQSYHKQWPLLSKLVSITFYGYQWISMDIHWYRYQSKSMDVHWYPCISMDVHGYPWTSIDINGFYRHAWILIDINWYINGCPWITMDTSAYSWISIDINGCPWISIDINNIHDVHEHPWISIDSIGLHGEPNLLFLKLGMPIPIQSRRPKIVGWPAVFDDRESWAIRRWGYEVSATHSHVTYILECQRMMLRWCAHVQLAKLISLCEGSMARVHPENFCAFPGCYGLHTFSLKLLGFLRKRWAFMDISWNPWIPLQVSLFKNGSSVDEQLFLQEEAIFHGVRSSISLQKKKEET